MGYVGFDMGFGAFGAIFGLAAVCVAGVFVFVIGRGIFGWANNNASPVVETVVLVTSKRVSVDSSMVGEHRRVSETTYVTFEVEDGERREFSVPSREFGLLAEGDKGRLVFRGTRYISFERFLREPGVARGVSGHDESDSRFN